VRTSDRLCTECQLDFKKERKDISTSVDIFLRESTAIKIQKGLVNHKTAKRSDRAVVAPPTIACLASLALLVGCDAVVAVVAVVLLVDGVVELFKRMALR
jgi:hypothetical protein